MSEDLIALKEQGNALFAQKEFEAAYRKYSEAINAMSDAVGRSVVYSNRAQCCLLMERWQDAKIDAAESLQMDMKNAKACAELRYNADRPPVDQIEADGTVLEDHMLRGAGQLGTGVRVFQVASHLLQGDQAVMAQFEQAIRDTEKLAGSIEPSLSQPLPEPPSSEAKALATRLKDEGNSLVTSNPSPTSYQAASAKFTLALVYDPTSAIIFSNRAYCANNLKHWDEASLDARHAISLDENFPKAWTRLGAALLGKKIFHEAEDAFNRGLQLLKDKPGPLSAADERLKSSIEQSIAESRRGTRTVKGEVADPSSAPWVLADAVINDNFVQSDRSTWYSSAWVICAAHRDFSRGVQHMYNARVVGGLSYGSLAVLESMSNGLVTDNRAFFVNKPDFFERYKDQILHELNTSQGFSQDSPQDLLSAVKARLLADGGWGTSRNNTSVRNALSVTIRTWFLNAYVAEKLAQDLDKSLLLYKSVIEFIELGRQEWATVPREQRGSIFELTWLLGVERNYAEALRIRYKANQRMKIPDSNGLLEQIKALGEKILAQIATFTEADRIPDREDRLPSFTLAFMSYPEAAAYSCLGFYYHHLAWINKNPSIAMPLLEKAAQYYGRVATIYPKDDELRTDALFLQLTSMFRCGRPLHESLPVSDELKQSMEDNKRIWRGSANQIGGQLDKMYQQYVWWAEDVRKGVAEGQFTMNDPIISDLVHRMEW